MKPANHTVSRDPALTPSPWRRGVWITLALAAVGGPLAAGWRERHGRVAVLTAPVRADTVTLTVEAVGTLVPEVSTEVGSRVSGTLESIRVREGQTVRRGQVLGSIDPDDGIGARERTASARMDAEARIAAANAALEQSRRDLARLGRVDSMATAGQSMVAAESLEHAELAVRQAEAALESARAVARSAAAMEKEADAFDRSRILVAPHDGLVLQIHRRVGETVVPATYGGEAGRVVTIVTPQSGRLLVPLSDRAALALDSTDQVEAALLADASRTLAAHIVRVGPRLRNGAMDGFEAELGVTGCGSPLPFGAAVLVRVTLARTPSPRVVPIEAVVAAPDGGAGLGVYVASNGIASFVPVTLAATGDHLVALNRGPSPGQRVIVPGLDDDVVLRPGLRIRER